MERIIGVYAILNTTNNKCYIGQSVNIKKRWQEHKKICYRKKSFAYNYPLYRAIRKYGLNNFVFSILEIVDKDNLTERETYWYNVFKPEYNQIDPRDNNATHKVSVYKIDKKTHKVIGEYSSYVEASHNVNGDPSSIRQVCIGKVNSHKGYYWCIKDDYDKWIEPTYKRKTRGKPIIQYDLESGKTINTFKSLLSAHKETKIARTGIMECVRNLRDNYKGYGWKYLKEDERYA